MITPLALIILAQAGTARAPLSAVLNKYMCSQGYERYTESLMIGIKEGGRHELSFNDRKGLRLSFLSHTFGQPVKPGRVFDPTIQAIYRDIPMKVAFAGQVEACVEPKKTRTGRVTIRFNIEDAHVYMDYGHPPERRGRAWADVNVEEAYKIMKPFADKYAALLKAELQKLRREKRVRRNYP